jgi:hypothetical protein
MSTIASSRERRRSVWPLSRRCFGRIGTSNAWTESRAAIRRNPKNQFASFSRFNPQNLAIANRSKQQYSTTAQWLPGFSRRTQ